MKKTVLILLICFASTLLAAPYYGADITLNATEYISFSGLYNGDIGWFQDGSTMYTNWGGPWLQYQAYLDVGTWRIGLNAINQGNLSSSWYPNFIVANSLTGTNIYVPASATEVFYNYITYNVTTAGTYNIRYTWTNDQCNSGYDANIKVVSVFFDNIATPPATPEPSTLALVFLSSIVLASKKKIRKFFR